MLRRVAGMRERLGNSEGIHFKEREDLRTVEMGRGEIMENREMGGQGSCEWALGKGEMKRGETVENGLIRERGLGKERLWRTGELGWGEI